MRPVQKTAVLVLGAESSGTRLVTQLFVDAGCYGDAEHTQRLDAGIPDDLPALVWRRSVPHAGQFPDIAHMAHQLQQKGYKVTAVIVSRDWHCMARSQVTAPHAPDVPTAEAIIRTAYRYIFNNLPNIAYVIVNYEALVLHPETAVNNLLARFGMVHPGGLYIYDGNKKYEAVMA